MAARKQFINRPTPNEKLAQLLEIAKTTVVSDDVLAAQRISFAFGNASDAENITKASVTAAAGRIRLSA
jgi:hypothetical protein